MKQEQANNIHKQSQSSYSNYKKWLMYLFNLNKSVLVQTKDRELFNVILCMWQ